MGGSTCSSTIALANAFLDLTFITEDLPDTIANATKLLSAQPNPISQRISTRDYDFFTPQPIQDGDVYLFRMIMHDWKDAECIAILRNQLKPLKAKPSARVLIMDTVLPPPGSISSVEEAILRVRDLAMIQSFNSTERDLAEFEELFSETKDEEGSLVVKNVIRPAGSVMSIIEVAYERFEGVLSANGHASVTNGFHMDGGSVSGNGNVEGVLDGH